MSGDAEKIGQIEVAEPKHVDAVDSGNLFDVFQPPLRFDLGNDQCARVGGLHFRERLTGRIVVMGEGEGRATPAARRIVSGLDDCRGLSHAFNHRYHYAVTSNIKCAR